MPTDENDPQQLGDAGKRETKSTLRGIATSTAERVEMLKSHCPTEWEDGCDYCDLNRRECENIGVYISVDLI